MSGEQAGGSKRVKNAFFEKDECANLARVPGLAQGPATSTVPASHFWKNVPFILVNHMP